MWWRPTRSVKSCSKTECLRRIERSLCSLPNKFAQTWRRRHANRIGDWNRMAEYVAKPPADFFHDDGSDDRDLLADYIGLRGREHQARDHEALQEHDRDVRYGDHPSRRGENARNGVADECPSDSEIRGCGGHRGGTARNQTSRSAAERFRYRREI